MRINAHAHIFNLQTVLTDEALAIMVNRVRKLGVPDYIADAVEAILQRQLDHPEYLNEDELLARFVRAIADSSAFGHAPELPLDVRVLSGDRSDLGVRALRATLNRISDAVAADRGAGKSPWDVFEALRVALQPDIPRVAGKLLSHMGPDDAIVALMMDITTSAEGERDRLNFGRQIRGTQEAVLAHPGRVLPFVAVNPLRSNHFELMRSAILEQGFLGVKLYPSLGYQMTTAKMARVLDFCREHDVPITIHTTTTGFNRDNATAQFCNPRHWKDLLVDDDPLRVCFAHCGGWGGFCGQDQDQSEWADRILAFMDRHPGIYADLSYHVDQMRDPAAEAAYFDALRGLIDGGGRGERILFGTDSWLLRLNIDDAVYWSYFEEHLGEERFAVIARDNPSAFLGLPLDGAPARPNVDRHLTWLEERAGEVGASPAEWVRNASDASWAVIRRDTRWSLNNAAHRVTFSYLRDQLPGTVRDSDFVDSGPVRLRQLEYFRRTAGGPSDRVLEGKTLELMAMASDFAEPEAEHDNRSVFAALREVLADPDRTVADVGAAVDALYLFTTELR
jgi:predicted TIM-barrel fold metal-dependent hydrolase